MQEVFEKLIEELERNASRYTKKYVTPCGNNGYRDTKAISVNKAIEIVKQEAEKYDNGWIPCDGVHLPEENVYVRVTTWTETEKIGFRRGGKWFVYDSDGMAEATVLAWQPTQPYQPKGDRKNGV